MATKGSDNYLAAYILIIKGIWHNIMRTALLKVAVVFKNIGKGALEGFLEYLPFKRETENQLGFSVFIWKFLIFGTFQFVGFSFVTNWLFKNVGYIAQRFPFLATPTGVRALCTVGVVIAGVLFYLLRERRRFVYANLELGVAVVSAHKAILKLKGADTDVAFLALLGSIYIAVRACDNYSKWYKQDLLPVITTIMESRRTRVKQDKV